MRPSPNCSHSSLPRMRRPGSGSPFRLYNNRRNALNPGTYCNGITISGATTVTFNPGTYILMGGGLNVAGASILKGSGVTLFLTQGLGYKYGPLSVSGASIAPLSAPTSGPYYGILRSE